MIAPHVLRCQVVIALKDRSSLASSLWFRTAQNRVNSTLTLHRERNIVLRGKDSAMNMVMRYSVLVTENNSCFLPLTSVIIAVQPIDHTRYSAFPVGSDRLLQEDKPAPLSPDCSLLITS